MSRGQKRYHAAEQKTHTVRGTGGAPQYKPTLAAECKDAQGQTEEETTSTAAFSLQETPD